LKLILLIVTIDGNPKNHENALIGLALVGRRLEEEKITALLQIMKDVVGVDY
jgi:amidase